MENTTVKKSLVLDSILRKMDSVIVAFSGGVDSSFLVHRAREIRKEGVMAVTIRTPYIPSYEIEEAVEFTNRFGIRHTILDLDFPVLIRHNPPDRCYLCKKTLFTEIINFANANGFKYIVDGTNADDKSDFRPGMKALKELGIRSPLLESGLTKQDIRYLLKSENLEIWDKPAMACLLTRIQYNQEIDEDILRMIERAENILFNAGFPGTRVRVHGNVARIECPNEYFSRIMADDVREDIIKNLKVTGFRYVSLDMEGYRSGSSDPETSEL